MVFESTQVHSNASISNDSTQIFYYIHTPSDSEVILTDFGIRLNDEGLHELRWDGAICIENRFILFILYLSVRNGLFLNKKSSFKKRGKQIQLSLFNLKT
jgi:hypothetical protein